jgi:glutamate carboxypeptidase
MSFEGGGQSVDQLRLATSGIAAVILRVKGRASHAGGSPHLGVNALYELSHQFLQMRDYSGKQSDQRLNWTVAKAGLNRNVIPPEAEAVADVRVQKISEYEGIEQYVRDKVKNQLFPESKIEVVFERRRPPLEAPATSTAFANHAKAIFSELGQELRVRTTATGGGTDAAFAALSTRSPVVEGFGLRGFGAHTQNAEYVLVDDIEPRLYLATRMIIDFSLGKVASQ